MLADVVMDFVSVPRDQHLERLGIRHIHVAYNLGFTGKFENT